MKNIKIKGLFLIIIFLFTLIPINFVNAGWLGGWSYRKSHTINGSIEGALTDYQIKIIVHYGAGVDLGEDVYLDSKCRTDFGDIRFTDFSGDDLLDYWIESKINSNYAIIWVEVDDIPDDPATINIYIYYGKGDATTTSNGVNTFLDFDDFSYVDCPTNHGWTEFEGLGTYSYEIENGELKMSANHGNRVGLYNDVSLSDYALDVKFRLASSTQTAFYRGGNIGIRKGANYYQCAMGNPSFDGKLRRSNDWAVIYGLSFRPSFGQNYVFSQRCYGNILKTVIDNVLEGSGIDNTFNNGYSFLYVHSAVVYYDDFRLRKYVFPEPTNGAWGVEEVFNVSPTITSASISDRDDGDNCYEMESYYDFVTVVNDGDGADTIAKVYLQIKQGGAVIAEIRATTLDGVPSYNIQTGATIVDIDVGSCSWAENGNEGTLHLLIRFEWDFTDQADLEISIYVEDTSAGSAGFTVMQTNYFDVIGRLVIYNYAVDDDRINIGSSSLHSGEVFYADTVGGNNPSTKYPLDAQFTAIHIHNSSHVSQGNDNSIINGVFSGISVTVPNIVQSNTYHVYLDLIPDYSDGDAPDGDTVAVIGDRIKILSLTANVTLLEVGEYAQLRLTAELEFDHHALGAGDFVEINSTVLTWDVGNSWFEADVTSAIVGNFTYNLYTDGLEVTFTITVGNINGKSITIEFIVYPPSDPNLLFGAGFNSSSPFVELHWNHSLFKVQFFEVQNSSDSVSWDYLGQSITTNYTDNQVVNGTNRYYKVRACNQTGGNWYNSSFTDVNFEIVYFSASISGAIVYTGISSSGVLIVIFLLLIGSTLIYGVSKRK